MTGWEVLVRELALAGGWQLGGGGAAIYSPPAPSRLDRPGYLDGGYYEGHLVEPVFAISVLDERRRPLSLSASSRHWNPARLELTYNLPHALITERRTVLPSDTFVSQLTLSHCEESSRNFWFVLWTRRPLGAGRTIAEIDANPQGLSFTETFDVEGDRTARWGCALGTNFDAESWSVDSTPYPGRDVDWASTPLADQMSASGLPGHFPAEPREGWLWLALAYPFTIAPGDRLKVSFAASFAPDAESARNGLEQTVSLIDPIHTSEEEWIAWFENCPSFECSDPFLQRAYWHRWAGRRLWRRSRRPGESTLWGVDGGIETAWCHDTDDVAAGVCNILAHVNEAIREPLGVFLRRIAAVHPASDWLGAVSSQAKLPTIMPSIDGDDLSPRSLALAIDLAESIADVAGAGGVCGATGERCDEMRSRLIEECWCEAAGWFLARGEVRTPAKTLEGVVPLLDADIDGDIRRRIEETLLDPEFFGCSAGLPGVSRDERVFQPDSWVSAEDAWRYGRICPGLLSMAIEALGRGMEAASAQSRALVAKLVRDFVRLSFENGTIDQPRSFDHYHPLNGRGSDYLGPSPPRGWLADHLIQFVSGLRPQPGGIVVIDPLPFDLEWFRLERVFVGDTEFDVHWDNRGGLGVWVDGKPAGHAPVGRSLIFGLQSSSRDADRRDATVA